MSPTTQAQFCAFFGRNFVAPICAQIVRNCLRNRPLPKLRKTLRAFLTQGNRDRHFRPILWILFWSTLALLRQSTATPTYTYETKFSRRPTWTRYRPMPWARPVHTNNFPQILHNFSHFVCAGAMPYLNEFHTKYPWNLGWCISTK